jgi:hypothetical protein
MDFNRGNPPPPINPIETAFFIGLILGFSIGLILGLIIGVLVP